MSDPRNAELIQPYNSDPFTGHLSILLAILRLPERLSTICLLTAKG